MISLMEHPFPKSTSAAEKCKRLQETVSPEDTLAILINADPDAMASAIALKRFFWRKVRKTLIYHINLIQRADNLALVKMVKIQQRHLKHLKASQITKWAVVDSQPEHHEAFKKYSFDVIIDHHPVSPSSKANFVDIREKYGATSTIMTEYLRVAKIRPAARLATALFYGIKTDTDNFVRPSLPTDINAFKYLYKYTNMNIIKKIESSEMTKKSLASYRLAMDRLVLLGDIAHIHMGNVDNPDTLVMIADFFMKLAEATWSIVSGVYDDKLIVVLRNAGFRGDAGKTAQKLFGKWGGVAGGHRAAARAEVPIAEIPPEGKSRSGLAKLLLTTLKEMK